MLKKRALEEFPVSAELKREFDRFREMIDSSHSFLISSTLTSDGDSIGAQLGLFHLISKLKGSEKNIWMVDESPVPERYKFLAGSQHILSFDEWQKIPSKPSFDCALTCDGGVERTGVVSDLFENIPRLILVDHHAVGSEKVYDAKVWDLSVSSTCELVYLMHEYFELAVPPSLAEALYVGIVFDTGFFKHSLTGPRTHYVAAQLIDLGIDFSKISDRAILERSWEAQLLLRQLLLNMERHENGRVILSQWTKDQMDLIASKDGDQEGMINQLYYTEGAEVIVLFTEKSTNDIKISFRSKGSMNVAELARSLDPQGGGHVRASGCSLKLPLTQARSEVLAAIRNKLSQSFGGSI